MDIQVGDRIIYKYMGEMKTSLITDDEDIENIQEDIKNNSIEIIKIERPKYEVVEEKKELLTEEEKDFLRQALRFIDIKILSINIYKQEISNKNIRTKNRT